MNSELIISRKESTYRAAKSIDSLSICKDGFGKLHINFVFSRIVPVTSLLLNTHIATFDEYNYICSIHT